MVTLKDIILGKTNDYSDEEASFESQTGLKLITTNKQSFPQNKLKIRVSVIISCYLGQKTLPILLNGLERQTYKNFEFIIIDDGSPESMERVVSETKTSLSIKFIREEKNMGRSYTRNTGMLYAEGECLIFTDQDVIIEDDFVFNFAIRQQYTSNCAFLGFKEDVEFDDVNGHKHADYQKDWRYKVKGEKHFINISLAQIEPTNQTRDYFLLKESNHFKDLGYGKTIGFWDLSSMIISHSLCVKKTSAIESGGFPEEGFDGWGAQDIAFGARLIGIGNYIVPVLNNVIFHISHPRYSGSREIELEELKNNVQSYFKMTNSDNWNPQPRQRSLESKKVESNMKYFLLKD